MERIDATERGAGGIKSSLAEGAAANADDNKRLRHTDSSRDVFMFMDLAGEGRLKKGDYLSRASIRRAYRTRMVSEKLQRKIRRIKISVCALGQPVGS